MHKKLLGCLAAAAFAFSASPALAQSLDGGGDFSVENEFYAPNSIDESLHRCNGRINCIPHEPGQPHPKPSREEIEEMNRNTKAIAAALCEAAAAIAGGLAGIAATKAVGAKTGVVVGVAVDKSISAACKASQ